MDANFNTIDYQMMGNDGTKLAILDNEGLRQLYSSRGNSATHLSYKAKENNSSLIVGS